MLSSSKENSLSSHIENNRSSESEQILQLKRLLVTLKQHYEMQLQQLQCQLQQERQQREALQKEEERVRLQLTNNQKLHEEELQALRNQQVALRDLLKKFQEESQQIKEAPLTPIHPDAAAYQQQVEELKINLQMQDQKIATYSQQNQELQKKLDNFLPLLQEKERLQEKYEQLKEEWLELSSQREEALEWRNETEKRLQKFYQEKEEQEKKVQDQLEWVKKIDQEKENLKEEKEKINLLFAENETRLKIAQQHLAKKVKETALLTEKIEGQQAQLTDLFQITEYQKSQLIQFQSSLDLYQRQEKRLQEQLHEALKGTESQVMKWEEKYFRMHDKWLESEALVQKLKKFEEKHHQMQQLLANLGSFMGASLSSPSHFLAPPPESSERRSLSLDASLNETPPPREERIEEKYDLFGMRHSKDKQFPDTP